MKRGSLIAVGTGIRMIGQLTPEARVAIEQADEVVFLALHPLMRSWMQRLNPRAESLNHLMVDGQNRRVTYNKVIDRLVGGARNGKAVCFVAYGHPGVCVYASREAIRILRKEGISATMLPAISAEDCMYADLEIDPGVCGCQSFEANDFLLYSRSFDPRSALILWQIDVIGITSYELHPEKRTHGLRVLSEQLRGHYPPDHPATLYDAPGFPGCVPRIERTTVTALAEAQPVGSTSLYVPPLPTGPPSPEMLARLGFT